MKQSISCQAPTKRRQIIQSDTGKADTTKLGTDEAKATHFIIGQLTRRRYMAKHGRSDGRTALPFTSSPHPYHLHQANDAIRAFNKTLGKILKKTVTRNRRD